MTDRSSLGAARTDAVWQPLRGAQASVVQAERALTLARQERDLIMHAHASRGATAYRLAQVTGLSQPSVARILTR